MSRIAKKLFIGKISHVEISSKEEGDSLSIEIQDESGGIVTLDVNYDDSIKLAKLINEMSKEIRPPRNW